jgi:CBS domain-containing protein
MQVREIMTENPACCSAQETVQQAATMMVENDCGEIPVVDEGGALVGVVTDRDIACRCVAQGKPADTPLGEIMTSSVVTVTPETSVEDCCAAMEQNQIRRVPVIDDKGKCCGIVSQADIARDGSAEQTSGLVEDISQPTEERSKDGCC